MDRCSYGPFLSKEFLSKFADIISPHFFCIYIFSNFVSPDIGTRSLPSILPSVKFPIWKGFQLFLFYS